MSKYLEAKTTITCADHAILLEAIKRVWKEVMGITLSNDDIEYHEEAVPLLGYLGDVRDGTGSYDKQLGNIIIRGVGINGASATAKLKTRWEGKSQNRHPGSHNDWAMTRAEDGTYSTTITDYDPGGQQLKISQVLQPTIAAMKIEKKVLSVLKQAPGATLKIDGEVIDTTADELGKSALSEITMQCAIKGTNPVIEIIVEDPGPLRLPPKAKPKQKAKAKPKPRRRQRGRGRGNQQRGRIKE